MLILAEREVREAHTLAHTLIIQPWKISRDPAAGRGSTIRCSSSWSAPRQSAPLLQPQGASKPETAAPR